MRDWSLGARGFPIAITFWASIRILGCSIGNAIFNAIFANAQANILFPKVPTLGAVTVIPLDVSEETIAALIRRSTTVRKLGDTGGTSVRDS